MLGGLIAGALGGAGKAVSDIAGDQIKQDQRMALMREQQAMEEQRMRLADELARSRAEWEVTELGDKKTAQDVKRTTAVGTAETGVLTQREINLAPIRQANAVSQTKAVKTAEGEIDREQTLARGTDRNYLRAVAALSDAKESSATRAAAAKTVYDLNRAKYADRIVDEAVKLQSGGDQKGAEDKLRVADMVRGRAQARSFSDVAAFAKVLESQAASLIDPAKGGDPTNQENVAQAAAIRQRIQDMADSVTSRRGVGGAPAGPRAAPNMPAPKTQADFDKLPKGTTYVAPDGSVRIKP